MADLIAVPLKKPTEIDIVKPLKNLIASSYSTADKPEDYSDQINELSKLRNNAVWRAFEKYESSLEVIYSYYDQLCALEGKIPPSEVQIPFKWKDAFNKGSLFGGRISLTISSLAYERVCVLFNIAALQSSVASAQSIENDEGLKLSAKLLQQSAGIFNTLKGTVMAAIQQDPTPDMQPDTLAFLSALMLAQAQEIFVHKAIHDGMKDVIVAKLSSQTEDLYAETMKLMQKELVRSLCEKEWLLLVAGKQAAFHGIAEYYQSLVCKANKAVGEEIARLQTALELLKAGQQRSGRPSLFADIAAKVQRNLTEALKDNDFIYHERIPDAASLLPIAKATVAKALPLPARLSDNFKDLFDVLVPMSVHQAIATYDVRKSEVVTTEINKLRESTQILNSVLASLNLPASLEDTSGQAMPRSLIDKSEAVCALGGIRHLDTMIRELPELLQRNRDILDEAERMLNEESSSDSQLKEQFKERWTRTPSAKLTEVFRANVVKYRQIIDNAIQADRMVKDKYEMHRQGMELLSEGPSVMQAAVPAAGPGGSSQSSSPVANKLRRLMEEVETMKAERDVIESELKSATKDMKQVFLAALVADGAINEPALSVETLGKAYGPLQLQVRESLGRQESLIADIQQANTEFTNEKSGVGGLAQKREEALKSLAAAHNAYIELQNNLKEGTEFYNKLTQVLVTLQNKISDFCFARKAEKEELMKDLMRDLSRGPAGIAPNTPAHHSMTDGKSAPPPRPPPPTAMPTTSAASLPYPSYPQGMPIPYGANPAAPYPATYAPAPMPPGYNPYATIAGYPHHPPHQQLPPQPILDQIGTNLEWLYGVTKRAVFGQQPARLDKS